MATPDVVLDDILATARSRTTQQFTQADDPIFDKYLQLITNAEIEIQNVFKDLMQLRDLDSAEGAQLDVIGRIVGQDRVLINADLYTFFGFVGALKAGSFGDVGNSLVGSRFLDYGSPTGGNITLDDETYRLFIRAKIYKNTTRSTPEEFIEVINLIFGTTGTFLSENGNANATVFFSRPLSDIEKGLLQYVNSSDGYPSRLIPKTVGVGLQFGEYQADNYFGFQGTPGAKGFGDINGTFGYGLGYGIEYGDSDYDNRDGGYFASIYQL